MYIDTLIKEGAFISDLSALIEEHGGFVVKNRVTKVSYPPGAGESEQLDESIIFSIAQHTLLRHEITQMIYGLAQYNEIEVLYGMMPPEIRTALTATDVTARADLATWVKEQSDYYQLRHTLYTYMCESYTLPDDNADNPPRPFMAAHEEPKRFVLDMEVFDTTLEGLPQLVYPQHFQSPITPFHLRIPDKEALTFGQPLYAPHTQTNWWADSKIRVRGVIAETHLFLMLLADTAPAFKHNVVPLVPLFWGLFIPETKEDDGNLALFCGSAQRAENPLYDFDALDPFLDTTALQPLLKDYIEFPANGVDDIMVYRTKNGAKYQIHRLIAEVESNIIPPPREHEEMKYPRAWQDNMHSQAYQYQMNPSRYSKRVETSRPIIYHPEEGKRGIIPDCLVCNPLSIRNGAIFKDRVQTCPDVNDLYRFFIIEGVSPFTKLPTTPFRPLGVALRMTEEKELDWKENLEQWGNNTIESSDVPSTPLELMEETAYVFKPDGTLTTPEIDPNEEETNEDKYFLLLCNGTWETGCVYKAYLNGERLVGSTDIERGGHKLYPLKGEFLETGLNVITIEADKSDKIEWWAYIYKQLPGEEITEGALNLGENHDLENIGGMEKIAHVTISFADIASRPPIITTDSAEPPESDQNYEITAEGNKAHIKISLM